MADISEQAEQSAALWEPVPDHVAYRVCRENTTDLLRKHPASADLPVPACPGWTVRDLVRHLLEVCEATRSSLSELPAPAPAAGPELPELLEAWTHTGLAIEPLLVDSGRWHGRLMIDAFVHELDIRHVVEEPPPVDHPAYPGALKLVFEGFSRSVEARRLPALRIETPGAQWLCGAGEPAVAVRGHRHDLLRSAAGRRTHRQIAELSWSGSCEAWLPAFTWGPFHPPAQAAEDALSALS